jgi:hypothetical protein
MKHHLFGFVAVALMAAIATPHAQESGVSPRGKIQDRHPSGSPIGTTGGPVLAIPPAPAPLAVPNVVRNEDSRFRQPPASTKRRALGHGGP